MLNWWNYSCHPSCDILSILRRLAPPQHDARSIVEPTEGLGGGSGPTLVRQDADVEYSYSSNSTIWKRNDLKPHRTRTFKLSKDPKFEQKFWDVIGLYLHPPEKALVLCCDEKTQCQALERSQPGLPLGIGHIRTRTSPILSYEALDLKRYIGQLGHTKIGRKPLGNIVL